MARMDGSAMRWRKETDAAEARSRSGLRRGTPDLSSKAKNKEQKGQDAQSWTARGWRPSAWAPRAADSLNASCLTRASDQIGKEGDGASTRDRDGRRRATVHWGRRAAVTGGEGERLCVGESGRACWGDGRRARWEEDDCALESQGGRAGAMCGERDGRRTAEFFIFLERRRLVVGEASVHCAELFVFLTAQHVPLHFYQPEHGLHQTVSKTHVPWLVCHRWSLTRVVTVYANRGHERSHSVLLFPYRLRSEA
jgi:hypothetical protein